MARDVALGVTSALTSIACRAVSESSTLPTPITIFSPSAARASRITLSAPGVVIVTSMAWMPPATSAWIASGNLSALSVRRMAMTPGSASLRTMSIFFIPDNAPAGGQCGKLRATRACGAAR